MLKIDQVNRWDSNGNEFIEKLEEKGIEYKVVFKRLPVFTLVSIGAAGGKNFDIIEYVRPSNGRRTLVANGSFGMVDMVMEEVYFFDLEDDQVYTAEEVAEAVRNYIIEEDEKREREEKERQELGKMAYDEVQEVAKTLIDHTFKLDFEIPDKSMSIQTSIVDIVKQRLDDREVEPIEVEGYFLKTEKENTIIIHNRFDILGQKTEISIYIKYDIDGDNVVIRKAY